MDISDLLSNHVGWSIMGVRSGDKYIAFGTTEVFTTNIEVKHEIQYYLNDQTWMKTAGHYDPPRQRITVTLSFGTFTMAMGDSYGEALAKLFGMWSPDGGERPALSAAQFELGVKNENDPWLDPWP